MGDSGTWVVGESNNELYGHVIGKDMFGDAYVIPIQAIFDDISTRLGAASVCIPDNEVYGDPSLSGNPDQEVEHLLDSGYSTRHNSTEHKAMRSLDSGYSTRHPSEPERSLDSVYSLELPEPHHPLPYYPQDWDEPSFDSGYSTRHGSGDIEHSLDSGYSTRHPSLFSPNPERYNDNSRGLMRTKERLMNRQRTNSL